MIAYPFCSAPLISVKTNKIKKFYRLGECVRYVQPTFSLEQLERILAPGPKTVRTCLLAERLDLLLWLNSVRQPFIHSTVPGCISI